jgi:hypothetical protein
MPETDGDNADRRWGAAVSIGVFALIAVVEAAQGYPEAGAVILAGGLAVGRLVLGGQRTPEDL